MNVIRLHFIKAFPNLGLKIASNGSVVAGAVLR